MGADPTEGFTTVGSCTYCYLPLGVLLCGANWVVVFFVSLFCFCGLKLATGCVGSGVFWDGIPCGQCQMLSVAGPGLPVGSCKEIHS